MHKTKAGSLPPQTNGNNQSNLWNASPKARPQNNGQTGSHASTKVPSLPEKFSSRQVIGFLTFMLDRPWPVIKKNAPETVLQRVISELWLELAKDIAKGAATNLP